MLYKICVLSFCCISRTNRMTQPWRWQALKRHSWKTVAIVFFLGKRRRRFQSNFITDVEEGSSYESLLRYNLARFPVYTEILTALKHETWWDAISLNVDKTMSFSIYSTDCFASEHRIAWLKWWKHLHKMMPTCSLTHCQASKLWRRARYSWYHTILRVWGS